MSGQVQRPAGPNGIVIADDGRLILLHPALIGRTPTEAMINLVRGAGPFPSCSRRC
jgi:hypothetical protein